MAEPLLEAERLYRSYPARDGSRKRLHAVDGISLSVAPGESLGVVGESGAGKSTLARLLLALERPDSGTVRFAGHPISDMAPRQLRPLRRRFQAVFQDPLSSLNPRLKLSSIVAEPLAALGIATRDERRRRVAELLQGVGLRADAAARYPGALSGGERQRVAIARALAPEPELLILDEPVSSLDPSVQGQIIDLLIRLRQRLALAMVLISHDLELLHELCDRVTVVYRGVIVEQGPTTRVLKRPGHPYTAALLAAAPAPDPGWRPPPIAVSEGSSPAGGCRYADRCPGAAAECSAEPALAAIDGDHLVACHFPQDSKQGRGCGC
jgi:oligopeptide/dipeptide ABC transporter ATP-binding protein